MSDTMGGGKDPFANKLIEALFDESSDMLILATEGFEILKANRSASVFLGLASDALSGRGMGAALDPASLERLKAIVTVLKIDGETFATTLGFLDYLGEAHRMSTGIRYIRCEECRRDFLLFSVRQERAPPSGTMDRIAPELLVNRLLKGFSDSVLFIDVSRRAIIDCNPAAEAMFGYDRSELIGRSPLFLAPSEELAKDFAARARDSYAKTGIFQDKIPCRTKDGTPFMTMGTNIAFFSDKGEHRYTLAINRNIAAMERRIDDIVHLAERSMADMRDLSEAIRPLRESPPSASLSEIGFTERQIAIAALVLRGETSKMIARRLLVSESSVKGALSVMYRLSGASSRVDFVRIVNERRLRVE